MSLLSGSNKANKKGGKSANGKPQANQFTPKPGKANNFTKKPVKTGGTRGS